MVCRTLGDSLEAGRFSSSQDAKRIIQRVTQKVIKRVTMRVAQRELPTASNPEKLGSQIKILNLEESLEMIRIC